MKTRRMKLSYVISLGSLGILSALLGGYTAYRYFGAGPRIERSIMEYEREVNLINLYIMHQKPEQLKVVWYRTIINKIQNKLNEDLQHPFRLPVSERAQPFEHSRRLIFLPNFDLACAVPPRAIKDALTRKDKLVPEDETLEPPNRLPPYCSSGAPVHTPEPQQEQKVIDSAKSVGAFIVKSRESGHEEFWGTGFMIADNIFAMSCHTVQPLLREVNGTIRFADKYRPVVHFDNGHSSSGKSDSLIYEFPVGTDQVTCSKIYGLDVALLTISSDGVLVEPKEKNNRDSSQNNKSTRTRSAGIPMTKPLPPKLPLYLENPRALKGDHGVMIAYADLRHFIDEHAAEMYEPFISELIKEENHSDHYKFAVLDWIAEDSHYNDNLDILLDTATTTLGESGGPVIDFFGKDRIYDPQSPPLSNALPPDPLVVGIHSCCAAYFVDKSKYTERDLPHYKDVYSQDASGSVPPALECAEVRRTLPNQAVSIWSVLHDPDLCEFLQRNGDAKGVDARDMEGKKLTITCNPLTATRQDQSAPSSH